MLKWPTIYRYQGRWWHGGLGPRWHEESNWKLAKELFWLLRHGTFYACWQWPQLIFGAGRDWYDGPIWFLHVGVFSVDLSYE